jgi:hypothetical protein
MCGFFNVWVCVCVGSVKCGCVYLWVLQCEGVLVILYLLGFVLFAPFFTYCFAYVYLFLFVTSVRTTATE